MKAAPLILDDLGTESATGWAREKLYQILNHRYNQELPTIITSNRALDSLDGRIVSRMYQMAFGGEILRVAEAGHDGSPSRFDPGRCPERTASRAKRHSAGSETDTLREPSSPQETRQEVVMTTLTIELAPDVYELLRAEARQRGKAEHEIIEQFLVERLTGETSTPPPPYVSLAPDVQALLTQMTESEMIVPPQGTAADAVRLLESWNAADGAEEDEEGEGTWEDVLRAVDANRAEYRKLFADLDTQP